jgi:hypothetical protein
MAICHPEAYQIEWPRRGHQRLKPDVQELDRFE